MASDPRPNVVFMTTDMQRYDTLGVNGGTWIRTPHLDALARRGINFDAAFIQNTICIPSRACMQTGRYPHQHSVQYMEDVIDDTPGLPPYELTFMERLQCSGYRTAGYGKIHMMPTKGFHETQITGGKGARWFKSAGLSIGLGPLGRDYAAWLEERHPGAYEAIYERRRQPDYFANMTIIPQILPLEEYVDYWTPQNTIDFIRRDHRKPFMVQCGFHGPHGPIAPPKPYDGLYNPEDVPLPETYGIDPDGNPVPNADEDREIARRYIAGYGAMITLIDDQVGRIVAALEETRQLDNTLIIFVADHGRMLWEHGLTGHHRFFEECLKVPLIVVPPDDMASAGRRIGEMVETFDVAATILDYALAEIPEKMAASSLRRLIEGRGGGKECVMSEYMNADQTQRGICLRTRRFKYVYYTDGGPERFYDLESDPKEKRNLIGVPEHAEAIAHHRVLLIDRLMCTPH